MAGNFLLHIQRMKSFMVVEVMRRGSNLTFNLNGHSEEFEILTQSHTEDSFFVLIRTFHAYVTKLLTKIYTSFVFLQVKALPLI